MAFFWQSRAEKEAQALAKNQALGIGPTAAQSQLAQGLSQSQGMMSAQAGGVRQNPLAAMRSAQMQGAQMAAQGQMQAAELRAKEQQQGQLLNAEFAKRETESQNALAGAAINMGSSALAAGISSDIRGKEQIQDGGQRTDQLLSAMKPAAFQYKDQVANGAGQRLGVMAQDVQRAAPELVDEGPDGRLRLDGPGALSANLAASARLAERLDALESELSPRARPAPRANADDERSRFLNNVPERMDHPPEMPEDPQFRGPAPTDPADIANRLRMREQSREAVRAGPPQIDPEVLRASLKRAANPPNVNNIIGQHQGKFTTRGGRGSWLTNSERRGG